MRYVTVNRSVVEAAEEEIRRLAADLKDCHTMPNGDFPEEDADTKKEYEYLIDLADRLKAALSKGEKS